VPKSNNSQNHWENNTETQIPGIADQIIRLPNTRMRYNNVCNQNNSKKSTKHTRNKLFSEPKYNNYQNHWENNTETQIPGIADQIIRFPNTHKQFKEIHQTHKKQIIFRAEIQ
jgi:hypothetical protein